MFSFFSCFNRNNLNTCVGERMIISIHMGLLNDHFRFHTCAFKMGSCAIFFASLPVSTPAIPNTIADQQPAVTIAASAWHKQYCFVAATTYCSRFLPRRPSRVRPVARVVARVDEVVGPERARERMELRETPRPHVVIRRWSSSRPAGARQPPPASRRSSAASPALASVCRHDASPLPQYATPRAHVASRCPSRSNASASVASAIVPSARARRTIA